MQHVLVQIIILSTLFLMTRLKPEVLNNTTVKSIKNHIPFLGKVCMPEKHFLKVALNLFIFFLGFFPLGKPSLARRVAHVPQPIALKEGLRRNPCFL